MTLKLYWILKTSEKIKSEIYSGGGDLEIHLTRSQTFFFILDELISPYNVDHEPRALSLP